MLPGPPHAIDDHAAALPARLALLGVPTDAGASRRGACMGPAALRIAGLPERLGELGFAVQDRGDLGLVEPLGSGPASVAWARLQGAGELGRRIADAGEAILRDGLRPIFLGGDHSVSMGSVTGVARAARDEGRPLFVLWIDAHTDYNTPAISPTGNPHGMALAFLCGEPGLEALGGDPAWRCPIPPDRVTVLGARSIDPLERDLLATRGVEVLDMRAIDENGVSALVQRTVERVVAAGGRLHVSLDVDVLDPAIAPGVATTVPGGLTFREAHLCMEILHDAGVVGSLDVVELNPFMDHAGASATLLVDLIGSLFGRSVLGRRKGEALR